MAISETTPRGALVLWQVSALYSDVMQFIRFEVAYGETTIKLQDPKSVVNYSARPGDVFRWFGDNPHDLAEVL